MCQAMRTSPAEGSPALSRRLEPGDPSQPAPSLDWLPSPQGHGHQPVAGAVPQHCHAQGNVLFHQELANTHCSQMFPFQDSQESPLRSLEVQGVGRAALQDALDVLLKGMLRLGHNAQWGHGQVLVLPGAQQGRGGRMDSAPATQQHRTTVRTQTETSQS